MGRIRSRLSYANVMATIAVFIALGGGAYAVGLKRNSVGPKQLKPNAVTGPDANESTFGQVPSAATAASATSASTAASADTADNAGLLDSLDSGAFVRLGTRTDSSGTATPSVADISHLRFAYGANTAVTGLTGGDEGQIVALTTLNANVDIAPSSTLQLSANWTPDADDSLLLVRFTSQWIELARSANP
jgi:hypothetical protein